MWYISLNDSSLSPAALKVCNANQVYTLQGLLEIYRERDNFRILKGSAKGQIEELNAFCSEVLQYISAFLEGSEKPETAIVLKSKKNISSNLNIIQLKQRGLISNELYCALLANDIHDLKEMKAHYDRSSNNFLSLRNIGNRKNREAIELINSVKFDRDIKEPVDGAYQEDFSIRGDLIDRRILANLTDMWAGRLKEALVGHIQNLMESLPDNGKLAEALIELYRNPDAVKGVGESKAEVLREFLETCREIWEDPARQKAYRREYMLHLLKPFLSDETVEEELEELSVERPLQIIEFIIHHSRKIRKWDHYILDNLGRAGIFTYSLNLKYEEAATELADILQKEVTVGNIKTWTRRLREKLEVIIIELLNQVPEIKEQLKKEWPAGEDFVFIDEELTGRMNEDNGTQFNITFYDILFSSVFTEYESVYQLSNRGFDFLSYVRKEQIPDTERFRDFILSVRDITKRNSPNAYRTAVDDLLPDGVLHSGKELFIQIFLYRIEGEIGISDGVITFPPTREGHTRLIDLIVPILEEQGRAMHYNEIVEAFDRKYPDYRRHSFRALRDSMDVSDMTMSLGGSSNYYILSRWTDKYHIGSIKNLIIPQIEYINEPVHFYELLKTLEPNRPGLTEQGIKQTFNVLSGTVFRSHGEGFYSLMKNDVKTIKKYARIHKGLYNYIDQNRELVDSPEVLLKKMKEAFPEFMWIQLEYVLYKYRNSRPD
ncbi:MAG: hypothetical protein JXR52_07165 [Bacteroidales bacterium]|nr:hypothetical protein [Bacteroidales bacterium]MBN2698590.1 hypothetical protein [Bacteroidales bacterium]